MACDNVDGGANTSTTAYRLHSLSPSLPQTSVSLGTVLLSMCYSQESKKLSVILLRAKDLNRGNTKETGKEIGRASCRERV